MIVSDKKCYLCGRTDGLQVHHCLHGSMRKAADKYGLTVYLCYRCHTLLHDHGLYDQKLQELAQEHFENKYGHEEYMRIFGKNYRR